MALFIYSKLSIEMAEMSHTFDWENVSEKRKNLDRGIVMVNKPSLALGLLVFIAAEY